MTEPVITINGRILIEPQATAVRVAITAYHAELQDPDHLGADHDGRRLTHAYRDRLAEVLSIVLGTEPAYRRDAITPALEGRINRILQLAGIIPEQASQVQKDLAAGYASAGVMVDEAAVRLQRAMGKW